STSPPYHAPRRDHARQAAQPTAATIHSRVRTRLDVSVHGDRIPGSSPSTKGRATISAVSSPRKERRSTSGPTAGAGSGGGGGVAFLCLRFFLDTSDPFPAISEREVLSDRVRSQPLTPNPSPPRGEGRGEKEAVPLRTSVVQAAAIEVTRLLQESV